MKKKNRRKKGVQRGNKNKGVKRAIEVITRKKIRVIKKLIDNNYKNSDVVSGEGKKDIRYSN